MPERSARRRRGGSSSSSGSRRSSSRREGSSRSSSKKRGGFKYRARSRQQVQKRATQSGGSYDSIFLDDFGVAKFGEGSHKFRIMPPGWEGAEHYGVDIWLHSDVGPDRQTYLCRSKMNGEDCCICEEQRNAASEGDDEYAKKLRPYRKVLTWVIDRAMEDAGPVLFGMPAIKIDKEIAGRCIDEDTGELIPVDHPEEGYDVSFMKEKGQGNQVTYSKVSIARKSSPLCDDEEKQEEWLAFIEEHQPLDCLRFYPEEYIAKMLDAPRKGSGGDDDDDEDEAPKTRRGRSSGGKKKRQRIEEDEEEEDEDEDEDEDEEEEEAPRSRRGRSRRRQEPDDEEDEDEDLDDLDEPEDDEEDEDEDDEEPKRRRGRSRKPPASKSKRTRRSEPEEEDDDEWDDEDEDDWPDDDEEEEEAPRSRRRSSGKKSSGGALKDKVKGGLRKRRRSS